MAPEAISAPQFHELDGVGDWRWILESLVADFRVGGFTAAAGFLADIAAEADRRNHHPSLDLRYPDRVRVTLTTHSLPGVSDLDVEFARHISGMAAQCDAHAEPAVVQAIEMAIDTMDADRIRPFWAAVLGYRDESGDLYDPLGYGPTVWFQQMDEPREQRNRIHVDVTVPYDLALARIDAALAAGGRMVTDRFARSWWVLADADGNEACVCTWQDRD